MRISLMEAYMIETLKHASLTAEQVAEQLQANDFSSLEQVAKFDYSLLQQLFTNDRATFDAAFASNYRVKFLTINGLKNLLKLKFGIEPSAYKELETGITELSVDEATEQAIRNFVSTNWTVSRNGDKLSITV